MERLHTKPASRVGNFHIPISMLRVSIIFSVEQFLSESRGEGGSIKISCVLDDVGPKH
jgi:hypothetical protein